MSKQTSQIKTYRAKSLQEALQMVRLELGPETTVLQTREVPTAWWSRMAGGRQYEIEARRASPGQGNVSVHLRRRPSPLNGLAGTVSTTDVPRADSQDHRQRMRGGLARLEQDGPTGLEQLLSKPRQKREATGPIFDLLAELLDAGVSESVARELIAEVRRAASDVDLNDLAQLRGKLQEHLENQLQTSGPICLTPDKRRVVALIGPTGVGKTTTIAKLAANLRLKDKLRVGLITVDTYRIAAVDQLRTYAEIIDLPMEVVSTPQEMRDAVVRLSEQDIVFIDTAGRSPHDEVQIQELKAMLQEARVDEVHLVLSAVGATSHLTKTVHCFESVGTTALLFTKLDEASGLGNLVPLVRSVGLPLSYLGCGQSVPDDIVVAEREKLASVLLGTEGLKTLV
ncbi:MAG: flagellar biosynthesis protein FlhF [Pirellulaceae bacterium]|nr:flagellar biosynthesis protein FlhF [Pirellulaceae bacterium]